MNGQEKKRAPRKRLSLKTETLRTLHGQDLELVQGGGVWASAYCRPTTMACTYH